MSDEERIEVGRVAQLAGVRKAVSIDIDMDAAGVDALLRRIPGPSQARGRVWFFN